MKEKTQLGFYLWAYNNVESVDYILEKLRLSYPDAELVISSDNGADMSDLSNKYEAIKYIHGTVSHGPCHDSLEIPGRYGWTVNEARLWLNRLYEACKNMTSNYVMLMEEDVLIKERFKFIDVDILMIPNFKNQIGTAGLDWIKSRGGDCKQTYYSCGGGSIIKRITFINAYETHINSFTENYERIYQEVMKEGAIGWGWNDSIICVLMYPENPRVSQQLPIIESGNEDDPAPIIHNFKKYYKKNLTMQRYDIINKIAEKINAERYLEIGVYNPADCFNKIKIEHKESVDPGTDGVQMATHAMTSDDFFDKSDDTDKWDIVFIDGLHTGEQVYKDVMNSLEHLSEGGYIVLHDCNPPTIHHAREIQTDYNQPAGYSWNGTVWKAFQKLRTEKSDLLDMITVDTDCGVGVIRKGKSLSLPKDFNSMYDYVYFDKNRKDVLLLVNEDEFLNWL